jgi:hypothetical protein
MDSYCIYLDSIFYIGCISSQTFSTYILSCMDKGVQGGDSSHKLTVDYMFQSSIQHNVRM